LVLSLFLLAIFITKLLELVMISFLMQFLLLLISNRKLLSIISLFLCIVNILFVWGRVNYWLYITWSNTINKVMNFIKIWMKAVWNTLNKIESTKILLQNLYLGVLTQPLSIKAIVFLFLKRVSFIYLFYIISNIP